MPVKHFGFAIARLQGINIYLALPPVGQIRHVGEFNPDVFVPFTQGRQSWHARTRNRIAQRHGNHAPVDLAQRKETPRSEEHTSELQSLMRISYAVFCLKKKTQRKKQKQN